MPKDVRQGKLSLYVPPSIKDYLVYRQKKENRPTLTNMVTHILFEEMKRDTDYGQSRIIKKS